MASGYIDFAASGNLDGRIYWSATAGDMKANSSTVTASIQVRKTNNATIATSGTWKYKLTIGTKSTNGSISKGVISDWVTIATLSNVTIAHNSDGSGSVKISGNVDAPSGTTLEGLTVSGSKTVTLDKIVRYATITSASDFSDEGAPSCKWSNPAGSNVTVAVGVYWDKDTALIPYQTVSGTSGTKTFTLTEEQKEAIYTKLKTETEATVYYYIRTTIPDSEPLYHKLSKKVSIVNAEPTFTGSIIPDAATQMLTFSDNIWIKGYTDLRCSFNDVKTAKGATTKAYLAICGTNKLYTSSGILENIEANIAGLILTDSRGNVAYYDKKATLLEYVDLTCNLKKVDMKVVTDAEGNSTVTATLTVNGNAYSGSFNEELTYNQATLSYRYKAEDESNYSEWIKVSTNPTLKDNKYSTTIEVTGLNYQKAYTFQVGIYDTLYGLFELGIKTSREVTNKAIPVFDWSAEDFNFNVSMYYKGKKLIYEAGDEITLNGISICFAGYISNGYKALVFTIPIAKPIFASGVKFSGNVICRGVGGYLNGTTVDNSAFSLSLVESGAPSDSDISKITSVITDAGITVRVDFSGEISNSTQNNSPICIIPDDTLTITFI